MRLGTYCIPLARANKGVILKKIAHLIEVVLPL